MALPPQFELRPRSPRPPFVWQSESELQHIERSGGGAYELAAWTGLTRMANSRRASTFRATIKALARLSGMEYGKLRKILPWFQTIGLLTISHDFDPRGREYRLCTPCTGSNGNPMRGRPEPSSPDAQVPLAPHAHGIQKREETRSIFKTIRDHAAPISSLLRKVVDSLNMPGALHVVPAGAGRPVPEAEPTSAELSKAKEQLSRYGDMELLTFIATNTLARPMTDTLRQLATDTPPSALRRTCIYVYAKGQRQAPYWSAGQRAQVVTSLLKKEVEHVNAQVPP
jgi:hypothetical protein